MQLHFSVLAAILPGYYMSAGVPSYYINVFGFERGGEPQIRGVELYGAPGNLTKDKLHIYFEQKQDGKYRSSTHMRVSGNRQRMTIQAIPNTDMTSCTLLVEETQSLFYSADYANTQKLKPLFDQAPENRHPDN
jgi:hypothetical protein